LKDPFDEKGAASSGSMCAHDSAGTDASVDRRLATTRVVDAGKAQKYIEDARKSHARERKCWGFRQVANGIDF
jgi:hypothetical protein